VIGNDVSTGETVMLHDEEDPFHTGIKPVCALGVIDYHRGADEHGLSHISAAYEMTFGFNEKRRYGIKRNYSIMWWHPGQVGSLISC
jgi:hypothetical protein